MRIANVFVNMEALEDAEYNAIWKWAERHNAEIISKEFIMPLSIYKLYVTSPKFPSLASGNIPAFNLVCADDGRLVLHEFEQWTTPVWMGEENNN